MMKITVTDKAVAWFKEELDLPETGKAIQFYPRYGGEFQLKHGIGTAFNIEHLDDVRVGYHEHIGGLDIVVSENDVWYFEDNNLLLDVNTYDEITYAKQ